MTSYRIPTEGRPAKPISRRQNAAFTGHPHRFIGAAKPSFPVKIAPDQAFIAHAILRPIEPALRRQDAADLCFVSPATFDRNLEWSQSVESWSLYPNESHAGAGALPPLQHLQVSPAQPPPPPQFPLFTMTEFDFPDFDPLSFQTPPPPSSNADDSDVYELLDNDDSEREEDEVVVEAEEEEELDLEANSDEKITLEDSGDDAGDDTYSQSNSDEGETSDGENSSYSDYGPCKRKRAQETTRRESSRSSHREKSWGAVPPAAPRTPSPKTCSGPSGIRTPPPSVKPGPSRFTAGGIGSFIGPRSPAGSLLTPGKSSRRRVPTAQPRRTRGGNQKKGDRWPEEIGDKIAILVQERITAGDFREEKWNIIAAELLQRHGVSRTSSGIKNFWNRNGRAFYKLDERRVPNPQRLRTSFQSPQDRKHAREVARHAMQLGRRKTGRRNHVFEIREEKKDGRGEDGDRKRRCHAEDDDEDACLEVPMKRLHRKRFA